MVKKKRAKKGIQSLLKQIEEHIPKLKEAKEKGNIGFERYTLREIKTFKKELLKRKIISMPRKKRVKYKKKKLKKN